jgi:hypothetical protein
LAIWKETDLPRHDGNEKVHGGLLRQLLSGMGSEYGNYGSCVVELTILKPVKREYFWFQHAENKFVRQHDHISNPNLLFF